MTMRMIKTRQQGITLVEILITIVVVVIGVLALAKLEKKLWDHGQLLEQQHQAMALAQQKIEELRHFETLRTETGKVAYQDIVSGSSNVSKSNSSYVVAWNVSEYVNPDYKSVNITVSWSDSSGASHNVNLVSRISKTDPEFTGKVLQ